MIRTVICAGAITAGTLGLAPTAGAEQYFANCTEAKAAGYHDIPSTSEYYWPAGDRDQDGIACES